MLNFCIYSIIAATNAFLDGNTPHFNGAVIHIHLTLEHKGNWWHQAILEIQPPDMSPEPLWQGGTLVALSDYVFELPALKKNPKWASTLPLKGGCDFKSGDYQCYPRFQNIEGNKVEQSSPIKLAEIEVVSRGPFLTQVYMWILGLLLSGLIGYLIGIRVN